MNVDDDLSDDELGNVTASPADVAYESGWHDGCDYGFRFAAETLRCSACGAAAAMVEV